MGLNVPLKIRFYPKINFTAIKYKGKFYAEFNFKHPSIMTINRIFQFLSLSYLSFVFISCEKNSIEPIDPTPTVGYKISGSVYEWIYPNPSPTPKVSAPVILDDDTTFSNSNGEFLFTNVASGTRIISVFIPDYEPYIDTLTILGDTSIGIQVEPIDTVVGYKVSGKVLESRGSHGAFTVPNAPVVIGNDTMYSNSAGEFYFRKVLPGIQFISIKVPDFEPFEDTVDISKDTTINFWLQASMGDYFPNIELNSPKRFLYKSSGGFSGGSDSGEAVWGFDSLKETSSKRIYYVKETLTFRRTTSGGSSQIYTTTRRFEIIIDQLKYVTINFYPWDEYIFNRYNDLRSGVIIKPPQYNWWFPPAGVDIRVKLNVGLYQLYKFDSAHLEHLLYQLIE